MFDFVYYLKAHFLVKRKKWKEALNIYKKIVKGKDNPSINISYRIGFLSEKIKDWDSAEKWLEKVVKSGSAKAQWFYRLALAQEMNKKFVLAAENYAKATELQPLNTKYFYRLGKVLWIAGKGEAAEKALQQALALEPNNALYAYELAMAIRKQGRTWQEVDALVNAIRLNSHNAKWHFELGEAQDKMNRFAEAGRAFAQANVLQPGNAMWHFREGWTWERAQQPEKAETAYAQAIAADKELKAKDFGVGVFHQYRGHWPQAAIAYAFTLKESPLNAELNYRLGLAYDRCYEWQEAAKHYRQALMLDAQKAEWHYRLGFVLERLELWKEAAKAYEYAATTRSTHTPYWFYRLGYVLEKLGNYEAACHAFLNTRTQYALDSVSMQTPMAYIQTNLSKDYEEQLKANVLDAVKQMKKNVLQSPKQAQAFYNLGNQAERLQMWEYAAHAYRAAIACSDQHNALWHYRLGYVLMNNSQLLEAVKAFLQTRIFKKAHGVDMSRYEKDKELMQLMEYTEYFENLPIQKNTIVYESFLGASIGCNPYAIYKSIVDEPDFSQFTHIWVINNETKLPFDFKNRENTILINRQTSAYRKYLATGEYLINNVTFPFWFIRRKEQKYLNTWHGTPLKGLGKDTPGEFMVHGNVTRNFLHATHLISPNQHTSDTMMKSYDIAGIFAGKLAETGYPRIDVTFNASEKEKQKIKEKLGLNKDLPVVVYAPTWRGLQGKVDTDIERLLVDIRKMCSTDYQIVFRGHHFVEKSLKKVGIPVTVAGQDIDANVLLSITDVLITDYSSIFFDFLTTKRPIIYYAYDLDEYSAARGLYFPLENMPGILCKSVEQVLGAINEIFEGSAPNFDDDRYDHAIEWFAKFEDGKSTRRVIDFLFRNFDDYLVTRYNEDKQVSLFYNGAFIPNGITSSFLNLINNIGEDNICISIAIDPSVIRNDQGRRAQFDLLPDNVKILPREGKVLFTPEEAWVENNFIKLRGIVNKSILQAYHKIYEREFLRLYGINKIKNVINFEGYSGLWLQIFAASAEGKKNIAWLHNDMLKEFEVRMPFLTRNFVSYYKYKKIISVSSLMNGINKKSLSGLFDIEKEKFTFCENTIDYKKIISSSNNPLDEDLKPWFKNKVFLTIGRMSPEKDHEKLIRAFAKFKVYNNEIKLVILGDGPLRKKLEEVIKELDMQEHIFLAGQRQNPFSALKACDCFILPSNHEGQPMVLLEALTLGKKIIATNIDGNRGLLGDSFGMLVNNSEEGLFFGMMKFNDGMIRDLSFDFKKYNEDCLNQLFNIFY